MIRFHKGVKLFRNERRPAVKPALLFLILSGFLLAACGTQVASTNWPGMTAVDDTVYVAYGPEVLAVNIADEAPLWSWPSESRSGTLFYAAPSVTEDQVVVGDYGTSGGIFSPGVSVSLYALEEGETNTPSTNWISDSQAQDRIIAPPLQVGDQVFVGTADNFILALRASDGQLQWSFEADHSIWGQPSYSDGVLYVSSLDKNVYALDSDTGQEVWPAPGITGGSISDRANLDSNMVFVGSFDGHVHAMDRLTGEIKWSAPASAADSDTLTAVWGAPVLADGIVYFVDLDGTAYAVNADDGRQLWTQPLDSYATAAPVIFENSVFIALAGDQDLKADQRQGTLVALEAGGGKELWRQPISAPVFSTPVIADDAVVIAYRSLETDLNLDVFEPGDGSRRWNFAPALPEEG